MARKKKSSGKPPKNLAYVTEVKKVAAEKGIKYNEAQKIVSKYWKKKNKSDVAIDKALKVGEAIGFVAKTAKDDIKEGAQKAALKVASKKSGISDSEMEMVEDFIEKEAIEDVCDDKKARGGKAGYKITWKDGTETYQDKDGTIITRAKGGNIDGDVMAARGTRIANRDSRIWTRDLAEFRGNNLAGKWMPNETYVVLSYGYYPLYVWNDGTWYENSEKYSVSTSKQQTQSRPTSSTIMKTTDELNEMTGGNPYANKADNYAKGGDVSKIDTIYVEGKYRDDGSDFYEDQETNDVGYVVEDFRNDDRGLSVYRIFIRFNDGTEREITKDDFSKGGKVKDFEKGKWLQGKQWYISKDKYSGWVLERYKGDKLIEQYQINVVKDDDYDYDFIEYSPAGYGDIKIPENVQLKVIRLLEKVNPKYDFGDEYENQIRINYYSTMYAKGGEVYDLRDRLIDLGDDDFVEFQERQSDDPNSLYYTFKERLEDYHGEELYAKGGKTTGGGLKEEDNSESNLRKELKSGKITQNQFSVRSKARELGVPTYSHLFEMKKPFAKGGKTDNDFKEQTLDFKYKGKRHKLTFTPTDSKEWIGFTSKGIDFDVDYDEEDNHIVVYEYFKELDTQPYDTIYIQDIKYAKGGEVSHQEVMEFLEKNPQFDGYNEDGTPTDETYQDAIDEILFERGYAKGGDVRFVEKRRYVVEWREDDGLESEYFDSNELDIAKDFYNQIEMDKFYYEKPQMMLYDFKDRKVLMGDDNFAKGGKVKVKKSFKTYYDEKLPVYTIDVGVLNLGNNHREDHFLRALNETNFIDDLDDKINSMDYRGDLIIKYKDKYGNNYSSDYVVSEFDLNNDYAKGGKVDSYVVIKGKKTKSFDSKEAAKSYIDKNGGEYAEIINGRLEVYRDQVILAKGGTTKKYNRKKYNR